MTNSKVVILMKNQDIFNVNLPQMQTEEMNIINSIFAFVLRHQINNRKI